jgi:hypothetical protein
VKQERLRRQHLDRGSVQDQLQLMVRHIL